MSRFRKRLSRTRVSAPKAESGWTGRFLQKILGLRPSYLSYGEFTGSFLNALSKSPMFLMFSTAPASTLASVCKGFTGQKSKSPNVYAGPYGLTAPDPHAGGVAPIIFIILILLLIALVFLLLLFSRLFAPIRPYSIEKQYAKIHRTQKPLGKSW